MATPRAAPSTVTVDSALLVSASTSSLDLIRESFEKEEGYAVALCNFNEEPCLVIHHRQLYDHPPLGPTSRCRIVIRINGEYIAYVLLREVERGSILESPVKLVKDLCSKYSVYSATHKFCPGVTGLYQQYKEVIRFDIKGLRQTTTPFLRVESVSCELWHKLPSNASREQREAEVLLCRQCVRLKCNLERQARRTQEESPSKRIKRQCSSSRARVSYMSPQSQMKRKQNAKMKRDNNIRKIHQSVCGEVPLDTDQNDEMCDIMSVIEEKCQVELRYFQPNFIFTNQ